MWEKTEIIMEKQATLKHLLRMFYQLQILVAIIPSTL